MDATLGLNFERIRHAPSGPICLRKYKNWRSHFEPRYQNRMLRIADCPVRPVLPASGLLHGRETSSYLA